MVKSVSNQKISNTFISFFIAFILPMILILIGSFLGQYIGESIYASIIGGTIAFGLSIIPMKLFDKFIGEVDKRNRLF